MSLPGFSIVMCCHDSAEVVSPSLEAVARLRIPDSLSYELIIIDNNCTDATIELAKSICVKTKINFKILKESMPGLIYARKRGVAAASYQYIIFLDDDNLICYDWIEKAYKIFKLYNNVGAIGGKVEPLSDNYYPIWFKKFQGVFACGPQAKKSGFVTLSKKMLVGAGLTIRTEIIQTLFSSTLQLFLTGRTKGVLLRGDDSEICMRCVLMGWDLWYESSICLQHNILINRITWSYVKTARYHRGAAEILLLIYDALIDNKNPMTYKQLSKYIAKRWRHFWKTTRMVDTIQEEGEISSFEYKFLTGMTDNYFMLGKEKYDFIRNQIMTEYKSSIKYKVLSF